MSDKLITSAAKKVALVMILPLLLPMFGLTASSLLSDGLGWPIQSPEIATMLVPKLAAERRIIASYLGVAAADEYCVAFLNYLVLCGMSSVLSYSVAICLVAALRGEIHNGGGDDPGQTASLSFWRRWRGAALLVLLPVVSATFVFFIPLSPKPSIGISPRRALAGSYASMWFWCSAMSIGIVVLLIMLTLEIKRLVAFASGK